MNPNGIALSDRTARVFESRKTVCFGRFVVDVPATAVVIYGPAGMPSDILRRVGEGAALDDYADKQLKETLDEFQIRSAGKVAKNKLYGTMPDSGNPNQRIVIGSTDGIFFRLWSFIKVGGDLYQQEITAGAPDDFTDPTGRTRLPARLALLKDVANRIRARADDEIPNEPGLCLDGAFLADNPAVTFERSTVGIQLKEFPDVIFSVETNRNQGQIVESDALEPRVEAASKDAMLQGQLLWYAAMRVLRRGQRQVGSSWPGFENLVRLAGQSELGPRHEFEFVAVGSPSDPNEPMLDVSMNTGVGDNVAGRAPISLSDEEAVAVWDKLIGSIRVRPVGPAAKVGTTDTPLLPLGELAASGRQCPQTGWWECTEGPRPVQGGRRRFFRAGDVLPDIVLLGQQSAWQKLKGEQPTHRMATVWQLVGHGES